MLENQQHHTQSSATLDQESLPQQQQQANNLNILNNMHSNPYNFFNNNNNDNNGNTSNVNRLVNNNNNFEQSQQNNESTQQQQTQYTQQQQQQQDLFFQQQYFNQQQQLFQYQQWLQNIQFQQQQQQHPHQLQQPNMMPQQQQQQQQQMPQQFQPNQQMQYPIMQNIPQILQPPQLMMPTSFNSQLGQIPTSSMKTTTTELPLQKTQAMVTTADICDDEKFMITSTTTNSVKQKNSTTSSVATTRSNSSSSPPLLSSEPSFSPPSMSPNGNNSNSFSPNLQNITTNNCNLNNFNSNTNVKFESASTAKSTINRLPIDTNEQIFELETQFLQTHNVKPYKNNADDDQATIIYSRALQTHYLWPIDSPLTIEKLSVFKDTGHTLNIDNTKTYCRNFALDLDCTCRKNSSIIVEHINENLVAQIQDDVIQNLIDILHIKADSIIVSIWRNNCGFHLYTNIIVSLPTHLMLKKIIEVKYLMHPVIFEVPTYMPLPYSAKELNRPYQQVNYEMELNSMNFAIMKPIKYIELFKYLNIPINGFTVATIDTIRGATYFVKMQKASVISTIPKVFNIKSISLHPSYSYMQQFETYIIDMVTNFNLNTSTVGDINLDEYNVEERTMLRHFMTNFNKKFAIIHQDNQQLQNNYETCKYFIHYSAINHGGLYLQPFTAALFLAMNIPENQFERFRNLLRLLYANVQYKSVEIFIKYISLSIYHAYKESNTSDTIINHLHYLHQHNVDPTQSINDQINTIVCSRTSMSSPENVVRESANVQKEDHEKFLKETIDMFIDIFVELQLVYHDNVSERYYCLSMNSGAHYESHKKLVENMLPPVLREWIGTSIPASQQLKNCLEHSTKIYSETQLKFSTNPFMFATTVGVFNSITGLYTANTRFLKFNKFRTVSIWNNPIRPPKMYTEQNEDIVSTLEIAKKYSHFMHNNLIELYTHAVIAPAFIQLPFILNVDECKIKQLFALFANHKQFECMYFLVEYLPIDPKIIYLMLHLCNEYDGTDVLLTYHTMVSRVFHYNKVSIQTWRDKFSDILDSVKYDETKPTYMEQLMSLTGKGDYLLDKNTCLFVVLFTACISKCLSYKMFVDAFNITIPLTPKNIHPAYKDFSYHTSMEAMRDNFSRARSIIFGDNLLDFESRLIDECISICMSANFIPETVSNILSSIGLSYIPVNIKKKIIVFHGHGDVGKSLLCKKLQDMVGPQVGRFTNLSKVMSRSTVSEYTVTIISELNDLVPSEIKAITGNDSESRMRFFSQAYELQENQSLMYGATNIHIEFRNSNNSRSNDVDRTTINRLYTILLTGSQCPANASKSNLLSMLIDGQFYMGILQHHIGESTTSLSWLTYCTYQEYRDNNFHPLLDVTSVASREYQNTVYYNNSRLYRFLVNSGIIEDTNFYISKNRFLDIIKNNLDKNFPDLTTFKIKFEQQYNVCFNKVTKIPNFQQSGLITHISENMAVVDDADSIITYPDILDRVQIYTIEEHRDNALQYFTTVNSQKFDVPTQTYKGISFQTDGTSYMDNVIDDNILMNPNSLVLQNV